MAPGSILQNFNFYSAKKGQHTITKLAIIRFDSRILWLSPSFGGSKSDQLLVEICLQKWMETLNAEEYGLGDQGFYGKEKIRIISTPNGYKDEFHKIHSHYRIQIGIFIITIYKNTFNMKFF